MKVTFQHLDSQSPVADKIVLFGRTIDDKSVAVWINGFRPSICIQFDRSGHPHFMLRLLKALVRYQCSKRILKYNSSSLNIEWVIKKELEESDLITYHDIKGQNICDYNETETPAFLKICAKNKWVLNDLKAILSRKVQYIWKQEFSKNEHGEKMVVNKKCYDYIIHGFKRPFTLFNDQVNYPLQYLIDKDIYSSSWMTIEGKCVEDCSFFG